MPHIIVHHCHTINVDNLLPQLHNTLGQQQTIDINAIKTRGLPVSGALVGDNTNATFVHVEIRLLSGRTSDTLNKIKNSMVQTAKDNIAKDTVFTLEIVEMNPDLYHK